MGINDKTDCHRGDRNYICDGGVLKRPAAVVDPLCNNNTMLN